MEDNEIKLLLKLADTISELLGNDENVNLSSNLDDINELSRLLKLKHWRLLGEQF